MVSRHNQCKSSGNTRDMMRPGTSNDPSSKLQLIPDKVQEAKIKKCPDFSDQKSLSKSARTFCMKFTFVCGIFAGTGKEARI